MYPCNSIYISCRAKSALFKNDYYFTTGAYNFLGSCLQSLINNKGLKFYGWMDELGFYVPSTVFQSFRDRVNMKGSVQ